MVNGPSFAFVPYNIISSCLTGYFFFQAWFWPADSCSGWLHTLERSKRWRSSKDNLSKSLQNPLFAKVSHNTDSISFIVYVCKKIVAPNFKLLPVQTNHRDTKRHLEASSLYCSFRKQFASTCYSWMLFGIFLFQHFRFISRKGSKLFSSGLISAPTTGLICQMINNSHHINGSQKI